MGHKEKVKASRDKHHKDIEDAVSEAIAAAPTDEAKRRVIADVMLDNMKAAMEFTKQGLDAMVASK